MQTKGCHSSSHSSHCKLVKCSSRLFTENFQPKNCQQFDSTVTDAPLQALGLGESIYGCVKQSSIKRNVECEDLPS